MTHHRLTDWATVLAFVSQHAPRVHPKTLLVVLETAALPDGVHGDTLHGKARNAWRDRRRFLARHWPALLQTQGSHVCVPDALRDQLPPPEAAASLARVLRALIQRLHTVAVGILCHAARTEPLFRGQIHLLPFCRDYKNCTKCLYELVEKGLVQIETGHAIKRAGQRVRLTRAGEALMLGHWGKAAKPAPAIQQTPHRAAA